MIYEILHKEVKTSHDEFEISYYIEIRRNSVSIIYEYLGLYLYDYRKYVIMLNCVMRNEYQILESVLKNIEKIYNNFSETRKLAIITKYVIYIVSRILDIPLYKLVENVTYEANGNVTELSTNAFVKSTYRLSQRFEKLIS